MSFRFAQKTVWNDICSCANVYVTDLYILYDFTDSVSSEFVHKNALRIFGILKRKGFDISENPELQNLDKSRAW